jgi:N-acetylated-alpha-linked acidic dipeptidase
VDPEARGRVPKRRLVSGALQHQLRLTKHTADVSVSGSRFNLAGSPSLAPLLRASAERVAHPTRANATLWDARQDSGPFTNGSMDAAFAATNEERMNIATLEAANTGVRPLGSGSDYTVFLQRLGVASSDGGFGFTATDAVYHYHSIYDSQHYQEAYADPGFHRHVAVAKYLGLTALSLTDAIILPINTTQYALELGSYLDRLVVFLLDERDVN